MDIEELIRQALLKEKNIYKLSKQLKITPKTIYRWINRETKPDYANYLKLMEFIK